MIKHLFRQLIDRCSPGRTYYDIAKEMARISLEGYDGDDRDRLFRRRRNSYNANLHHYRSGKNRPEVETLILLSKAIGCSPEELIAIFYT